MNNIHKKFGGQVMALLLAIALAQPLEASTTNTNETTTNTANASTTNASTPTANPAASPPAEAQPKPLPNNHDVLKTVSGLLLTLGLLFVLLWALKKTGMGLQPRGRGFYRIVASSTLGSRERICLLEVGNTWLVVGMTAHSMNTLHTLPAGSIDIAGPSPMAAEQFAKLLGHLKPKPKEPKPKDTPS